MSARKNNRIYWLKSSLSFLLKIRLISNVNELKSVLDKFPENSINSFFFWEVEQHKISKCWSFFCEIKCHRKLKSLGSSFFSSTWWTMMRKEKQPIFPFSILRVFSIFFFQMSISQTEMCWRSRIDGLIKQPQFLFQSLLKRRLMEWND